MTQIGRFALSAFVLAALMTTPAAAKPSPASPARSKPDNRSALATKFDAYLRGAVQHDQFIGTVLVARDGVPIFTRSYGMANIELGAPNTPGTGYVLASLAKQFTATAILQLQERGKLAVTDPICKYLKDCPAAWSAITIRNLLTHTSGIPNFSSLPDWDENLSRRTYRHGELVALVRGLPLRFAPGSAFEYSNSGYYLLGLIVERAAGRPYADVLRERIFAPLDMAHTRYSDDRALVPGLATGYYSRGSGFVNAPYEDPSASFGAGAIISTVGDLLRWDQALYTDKLLSRTVRDAMFTPYLKGYAYGWRIDEKFGRRRFEHSGDERGFSTYIARFPDDRVTVIVLGNSARTSAGKIGTNLAAIAFGQPYKLPVAQARDIVWDTLASGGPDAAKRRFGELRRATPARTDVNAETLLDVGYDLIEAGRLDEAAAIFRFCIGEYPTTAYAYDGLADVAISRDDTSLAIDLLKQSLKLDPDNNYASERLAQLTKTLK